MSKATKNFHAQWLGFNSNTDFLRTEARKTDNRNSPMDEQNQKQT